MDVAKLRLQLEMLHPLSYRWAVACCDGDEAEAEDVLQSTYLKILQGKAKYGGESAFKTWLFAVVRNTARELSRQRRIREAAIRRGALNSESPGLAPDSTGKAELADDVERLRSALRRLSKRQQEVLHLVFFQEITVAESAEVLGVSVGAARTHYERAKENLRQLLTVSEGLCSYGSLERQRP